MAAEDRLVAVHEEALASKAQAEKMGLDLLKNLFDVSYNGVMWVSMESCRSMVPDPATMNACMREAWEELLAAADARPGAGRPPRSRGHQAIVRRRPKRRR
jgi:hypothetical protein